MSFTDIETIEDLQQHILAWMNKAENKGKQPSEWRVGLDTADLQKLYNILYQDPQFKGQSLIEDEDGVIQINSEVNPIFYAQISRKFADDPNKF